MEFFYFSDKSERAWRCFMLGKGTNPKTDPLRKKMALCGYRIFLIADDQLCTDRLTDFKTLGLLQIFNAWQNVQGKGLSDMAIQQTGWEIIEHYGQPFYDNGIKTAIVWKFRSIKAKNAFFILLSGFERDGLPRYELLLLSNLWQLMNGALPLHSSGVVYKDRLFIFAGQSGAGKSTVAKFGIEMGGRVLDEDQVLVQFRNKRYFSAVGWGFDVVPYNKPIRAIFKLIQDTTDRIEPLTQSRAAQLILENSNEIFGDRISEEGFGRLFAMSSAIARQIPGFELHFRKSPDFWKLIDENFPQ